jgi:hypothetical protein
VPETGMAGAAGNSRGGHGGDDLANTQGPMTEHPSNPDFARAMDVLLRRPDS